jgi:hypothetical protein
VLVVAEAPAVDEVLPVDDPFLVDETLKTRQRSTLGENYQPMRYSPPLIPMPWIGLFSIRDLAFSSGSQQRARCDSCYNWI